MFRNALQPWHLLIVGIVFILLFGAKRLPDTARSLGKSLRILKSEAKAMREDGAQSASASTADAPHVPQVPGAPDPGSESRGTTP